MIDRKEFLRKTAVAAVGAAILPAVMLPDPEPLTATMAQRRYYVRMAIDNKVSERLSSNRGAFDELNDRILDQLWSSWADMGIRHT